MIFSALFVRVTEKKAGIVKRHLSVTQKEAFDAALDWVDSQPRLVRTLRDDPSTLEDGVFEVEAKKGLLGRLLSSKKNDDDDVDAIAAKAQERASSRSDEEKRRIAETKRLVEEALSD